jgi:dTDP-4-amino-4,6-dideoxygalactose transaminase
MSIPLFDMAQHIESNRLIYDTAFNRVLDCAKLIMGSEVENFEFEFAKYLNINFCTSVANGTDALEIALRGLGAKGATRVGLAGNCGGYARAAVDLVGCTPVYISIDPANYFMSFSELSKKIIEGSVDIVIVTHLYGQVYPNIIDLSDICKKNGVLLIEDCAQATGATVENKKCGTFGDVGTFSFYPTKNLGALGDGGAIVCHEFELANRYKSLRQYGWESKYQIKNRNGRNSRLDEIQAAFLRGTLPFLDSWNLKRTKVSQRYLNEINNPKTKLPSLILNSYVGHIFPIFVSETSKFRNYLAIKDIDTAIHYPINDEAQDAWLDKSKDHPYQPPVSIPISQYISYEHVSKIIDAVNTF